LKENNIPQRRHFAFPVADCLQVFLKLVANGFSLSIGSWVCAFKTNSFCAKSPETDSWMTKTSTRFRTDI
jgi:hypothetical protein